MTKEEGIKALQEVLEDRLASSRKAYEASRDSATSDQSKQESKYDTHGLEESYLAHGLTQSLIECEQALADLAGCRAVSLPERIDIGSLIECRTSNGKQLYFLLSLSGGGVEANIDGKEITIITPSSPLGNHFMHQSRETASHPKFQITSVL